MKAAAFSSTLFEVVSNASPVSVYLLSPTQDAVVLAGQRWVPECAVASAGRTGRPQSFRSASPQSRRARGRAKRLRRSIVRVIETGAPDALPTTRCPIRVERREGGAAYESALRRRKHADFRRRVMPGLAATLKARAPTVAVRMRVARSFDPSISLRLRCRAVECVGADWSLQGGRLRSGELDDGAARLAEVETSVTLRGSSGANELNAVAKPSDLTCPECGYVWTLSTAKRLRYAREGTCSVPRPACSKTRPIIARRIAAAMT